MLVSQVYLPHHLMLVVKWNESCLLVVHIESSHVVDQLALISLKDLTGYIPHLRIILYHFKNIQVIV
jgi:hypothetical protein